jgi:beta-lactamase class A
MVADPIKFHEQRFNLVPALTSPEGTCANSSTHIAREHAHNFRRKQLMPVARRRASSIGGPVTTRRDVAIGICALAAGMSLWRDAAHAAGLSPTLASQLATIERESGGRLGVAVLDTLSGARASHRADERFPMGSTFKMLAAAAVLARVDSGKEQLDRRITFEASEVVIYSPITKERAGAGGMTLAEICEAAVTMSDNTAGNLLLATIGGPAGLTAYVRSLGDNVTRLDRIEPELNEALPGDPRDTTAPGAMLSNLQALVLGNALSAPSKERLTAWLLGNKTGEARLRAGLPKDWRVGDKTGAGDHGTANDVGIAWPPGRAPVLIAAYLTGTTASADQRNATLAAVARAASAALDR